MLPEQVAQVPQPLPVRRGFPHYGSITVIFEKFLTRITSMVGESLPTKK